MTFWPHRILQTSATLVPPVRLVAYPELVAALQTCKWTACAKANTYWIRTFIRELFPTTKWLWWICLNIMIGLAVWGIDHFTMVCQVHLAGFRRYKYSWICQNGGLLSTWSRKQWPRQTIQQLFKKSTSSYGNKSTNLHQSSWLPSPCYAKKCQRGYSLLFLVSPKASWTEKCSSHSWSGDLKAPGQHDLSRKTMENDMIELNHRLFIPTIPSDLLL